MIVEKLLENAKKFPHRTAVVAQGNSISYEQLEYQSSVIARNLLNHKEIKKKGPDHLLIGIFTSRDIHAISLLFGILKAHYAYTFIEEEGVLNENYKSIQSLDADFILCSAHHVAALKAIGVAALAQEDILSTVIPYTVFQPPLSDTTAYVLFTSGSTGKSKGVMVSYGNISHYCSAIIDKLAICQPLNFAHVSTLSADLGNTTLFLSFITGGCLHILAGGIRKDPEAFRQYCQDFNIEFIKITPSHWRVIFQKNVPSLEYLVFGGEALPKKLATSILRSGKIKRLFNHYGPTEATIGITLYPIKDQHQLDTIESDTLPIGYPFGMNTVCVYTEQGEFCSKGELYVSGPSVALGYRHDPMNTQNKFVQLKNEMFSETTTRFYRTGDLVQIDNNGCIYFLGRVDRQVKINGYRVELEHIETVMRSLLDIDDAAVFYLSQSQKNYLVAAVQSHQHVNVTEVKSQLKQLIPEYMIPKVMMQYDNFAVTANGKKDLPALKEKIMASLKCYKQDNQPEKDNRIEVLLHRLFEEALDIPVKEFDHDSSFYDIGGDSLGAIQLIFALQDLGYSVTALSFFKEPTINGIMKLINKDQLPKQPPFIKKINQFYDIALFSPAQYEFFAQNLKYADYYNQSILLDCGENKIDVHILHKAIDQLIKDHPILSTAFFRNEQNQWVGKVENKGCDENFSVSFISSKREQNIQDHIETVAEQVNKSLSLKEGRLFKVHLFKSERSQDMLLMVCHHLAIDLVSWHIITAQINRNYTHLLQGTIDPLTPTTVTFWEWLQHVNDFKTLLEDEWVRQITHQAQNFSSIYDAHNTEGAALTYWLGFSKRETKQLQDYLFQHIKEPIHVVLLASFLHALQQNGYPMKTTAIEIESHGRVTFEEEMDISRVVGWHTSTSPLFIHLDQSTISTILHDINYQLKQVTHLGVGYGLHRSRLEQTYRPSGPICFNYLGNINFETKGLVCLKPNLYSFGRSRHRDNHRTHDIKLTGKIVHDCLFLDVSFPYSMEKHLMQQVMEDTKTNLAKLANIQCSHAMITHEEGTRTGMINYVPRAMVRKLLSDEKRLYNHIFITGATGYLGAHAFKELLENTQAIIHCLVRSDELDRAMTRLSVAFNHYFPDIPLAEFEHRIKVYAGNIAEEHFGLDSNTYNMLCQQIEAIYHFAADTRLLGDEVAFKKTNLKSVQNCIDLALTHCQKDLHYMSTLAVSGVNTRDTRQEFSEHHLDIGQEFQNHYELTKYNAENLLNSYSSKLKCFIYRTGNVAGSSITGRFQKNAKDNRLVQFLVACSKIGQLPKYLGEDIILSPVDIVAKGIVNISLNLICTPAVYHVDSPYHINMEKVFQSMQRNGFTFIQSEAQDFSQLFQAFGQSKDRAIALGHFWVRRGGRNIKYCNEKTVELLNDLQVNFLPMSDQWLDVFIGNLMDSMNNIT